MRPLFFAALFFFTLGESLSSSSLPLSFPRDQGAHEDAKLEWWYVTGQLDAPSGQRLGFQLTFFRVAVEGAAQPRASAFAAKSLHLAHFARTDVAARAFRVAERTHRDGPGAASTRTDRLDVANEDWRLEEVGGHLVLFARDGDESLSLVLTPERPLVLHGDGGVSRKGPEPDAVSRYVSYTRLAAAGWWTKDGTSTRVSGLSWFDHEWGPGSIGKGTAGWDWFALHLADGRDLMMYRLRGKEGDASPFSSGTLVEKDGRAVPLSSKDFLISEIDRWKSPRSGASYPSRWRVRVPGAGVDVSVVPVLANQELVTERSTRVTYWEGACDVVTPAGAPAGRAYVELTGYAGAGGLGLFR